MYALLRELTRLQEEYGVHIEGLFMGVELGEGMTVKIVGSQMNIPRNRGLFERTVPNSESCWDEAFENLTRLRGEEAPQPESQEINLGETTLYESGSSGWMVDVDADTP